MINKKLGTGVIKLNKYSFKFEDIDIIYPVYVRSKNDQNKSHNFRRSIANGIRSRKFQLDHRSIQAYLFDKLIELGHFKLLGLGYKFIPELPIINTRSDIDEFRTYYLLDYFIPDLSLCIELDSDLHNLEHDRLKDKFLNSIGIDVYRIYNFQSDTKDKLDSLVQYIRGKEKNKFELGYSDLIEYSKIRSLNELDLDIYESYGMIIDDSLGIKNKWKPAIMTLGNYDPNFMNAVLTKSNYILTIGLDEIYELIPMDRKRTGRYNPLVNYLRSIGIELNIKSEIGRNQYSKRIQSLIIESNSKLTSNEGSYKV